MAKIRRMGKGHNTMELIGGPYGGDQLKLDDSRCTLEFTAKGMHGRYVSIGPKKMVWQEISK